MTEPIRILRSEDLGAEVNATITLMAKDLVPMLRADGFQADAASDAAVEAIFAYAMHWLLEDGALFEWKEGATLHLAKGEIIVELPFFEIPEEERDGS